MYIRIWFTVGPVIVTGLYIIFDSVCEGYFDFGR